MSVRVRFAPSPTGYLHVGGLRTALYNYLFCRNQGGKFILRIEDTDRTRFVENATEGLIEILNWAGIKFDEGPGVGGDYGPYVQSERLEIYKKYANILIQKGNAYYAFDSPEEIEQMRKTQQEKGLNSKYDRETMKNQFTLSENEVNYRIKSGEPYVVRLLVPENYKVHFTDIIRGEVVVDSIEIDDQVLQKSDGYPTYHLANVVDDYLMKITHVIRGEEWLPSTPKHILLYEAFGWDKPQFAHLPLLLNKDKSKLSKRQGDVAVEDYRKKGYFKEAIINFVALLGWNPSGDREIYELQELIDNFKLEKVNKGGAVFDIEKLNWMNFQYLMKKDTKELALELQSIIKDKGYSDFEIEYLEKVIRLHRERVTFLHQITDFCPYMFQKPEKFDREYFEKHWKDYSLEVLKELKIKYSELENFDHDNLHKVTNYAATSRGLKLKDIIHTIRLVITGRSAGAGMFETMELLGKNECLSRIQNFIENYEKNELVF